MVEAKGTTLTALTMRAPGRGSANTHEREGASIGEGGRRGRSPSELAFAAAC